jgi:3-oxoacyl-[acyl-carrier protein] reductase
VNLGLAGTRALVTAASQGLGRACAASLANEGSRVVITSRNAARLEQEAAAIGAVGTVAGDMRVAADTRAVVEHAVEVLGGLDILVVNCGPPPALTFSESGDDAWEEAHELVLMSAIRLTRTALPHLRASGRGRIVNLTGYGVREPISGLVISEATRASVTVLAKVLANDLGPDGVTVNNIAPGPVLTDRLRELQGKAAAQAGVDLDTQLQRYASEIPVRRVGRPEEVADLCTYLCSQQAAFITGQTVVVDGGINRSV